MDFVSLCVGQETKYKNDQDYPALFLGGGMNAEWWIHTAISCLATSRKNVGDLESVHSADRYDGETKDPALRDATSSSSSAEFNPNPNSTLMSTPRIGKVITTQYPQSQRRERATADEYGTRVSGAHRDADGETRTQTAR